MKARERMLSCAKAAHFFANVMHDLLVGEVNSEPDYYCHFLLLRLDSLSVNNKIGFPGYMTHS